MGAFHAEPTHDQGHEQRAWTVSGIIYAVCSAHQHVVTHRCKVTVASLLVRVQQGPEAKAALLLDQQPESSSGLVVAAQ